MDNKKRNLGLFFTAGVSVDLWSIKGMLNREKVIYEQLLEEKFFDKVFWFTYGSGDKKYQVNVNKQINIIAKPKFFDFRGGDYIYSFLLPLFQHEHLKQCHILKTNQMWGSWSAVFAKWLFRKKLYVRTGFTASKFFKLQNIKFSYIVSRITEWLAYKNADISSVTSKSDYDYITTKYNPKSIEIIPNYVDTEVFKNYNTPKNKDLVFVGRLNKQKNLFNLFKALEKTNYHLDIYSSGELKNNLIEYAKQLKIQVNFFDPVSNTELPRILNQYKVYVLCSFYEGMPKTLIEAMACGLACLGTNVEGINSIIKHSENGWLVDTNAESIRDGLQTLMKKDSLRTELDSQARIHIIDNFSLDKVLKSEIKIISDLL